MSQIWTKSGPLCPKKPASRPKSGNLDYIGRTANFAYPVDARIDKLNYLTKGLR